MDFQDYEHFVDEIISLILKDNDEKLFSDLQNFSFNLEAINYQEPTQPIPHTNPSNFNDEIQNLSLIEDFEKLVQMGTNNNLTELKNIEQEFILNEIDMECDENCGAPTTLNTIQCIEPNFINFNIPPNELRRPLEIIDNQQNMVRTTTTTKKNKKKQEAHCVFCLNNKQPYYVYSTHQTRDDKGRVICPHLRNYECPICGENGDNAHTVKYCPKKPILSMEDIQNGADVYHQTRRNNYHTASQYNPKKYRHVRI